MKGSLLCSENGHSSPHPRLDLCCRLSHAAWFLVYSVLEWVGLKLEVFEVLVPLLRWDGLDSEIRNDC